MFRMRPCVDLLPESGQGLLDLLGRRSLQLFSALTPSYLSSRPFTAMLKIFTFLNFLGLTQETLVISMS